MKKNKGKLALLLVGILIGSICYASQFQVHSNSLTIDQTDHSEHDVTGTQINGTEVLGEGPAMESLGEEAIEQYPIEEGLLSLEVVNYELQEYGEFTVAGMKTADYVNAMQQQWHPVVTDSEIEDFSPIPIDLSRSYSYENIEKIIRNFATYYGVEVNVIGQTTEGRNIYSVTIDNNPDLENRAILLTGGVHARECAGGMFVLKQLEDLIKKNQYDLHVDKLLGKVRIEAVPFVNPDGWEAIRKGGNVRQKSNARGIDLNRNFPSTNAWGLSKGYKPENPVTTKPGIEFFPGYNLGSESETQALMKWLDTYIPKAIFYIDYHQQGRGIYTDKPWNAAKNNRSGAHLTDIVLKHINHKAPTKYVLFPNNPRYGFNNGGGTITDYAASVAMGLTFSEQYGRMVLALEDREFPVIAFKNIDNYPDHELTNDDLGIITLEIGLGLEALGYNTTARNKMAKEYTDYNFDTLLIHVIEKAVDMHTSAG